MTGESANKAASRAGSSSQANVSRGGGKVGAQPQVHKLCLQMLAPDTAALALRRT